MVSVIVPNYNHANYLQQRIESILNQTYADFEIIILDDCSTDNSKEIIEKYREQKKITSIIYNSSNSGSVFKQWEKGISLAKGNYIWIAESDDYAENTFLAELVPVIEKDQNLGFVYCDSYIVEQDQSIQYRTFSDLRFQTLGTSKWKQSYNNDGKAEISECLLDMCTVNNASAVLFRKSAIIECNPFDRQYKYFGDWYCYLRICQIYPLAFISKPLNYYRDHSANASKKMQNSLQYVAEYFNIYDWAIRNLDFVKKPTIKRKLKKNALHSFFKGWGGEKRRLYLKLSTINFSLFIYLIGSIIKTNFINVFKTKASIR